jgi:hypothetical protein
MSIEEEMKDDDGKATTTTTTTTTMADGPGVDEVDDNAATNVNVDPAVGGLKNADDASPNETTSEAGKKEETMTTTVTPTTADSSSSKMETMEDEALPTTGGEKGSKDASAADDHRKLMMHTKSFRAPTPGSAASRELEVYIATWNVGNKAPTMEAASEWLSKARMADIVAIGAQEASYLKTKKTVKPPQVSTELGDSVVFKSKLKKRGFFKSTKWTRMGMMAGGAFAGGVMGSAPGAMCGMFTGYYAGKKFVQEVKGRIHWFDFLAASMGDDMVILQSEMLLQMRLAVFIKKDLEKTIRSVKVGSKATGLGNLVGNKGGMLVHIEFENGETIAFVSCHLAAHEKPNFLQARNEMVPEILNGVWRDSSEKPVCALPVVTDVNSTFFDAGNEILNKIHLTGKSAINRTRKEVEKATKITLGSGVAARKNQILDLLNSTTHVFFFGDLNYRLDPGMIIGNEWNTHWEKEASSHSEKEKNHKFAVEEVPLSKFPASRPAAQPGVIEEESDDEAAEESPFLVGRQAVLEAVAAKRYEDMEKADQLLKSKREGKIFTNFREMPLRFIPTFKRRTPKVKKPSKVSCSSKIIEEAKMAPPGTPDYYNEKRVPSWCDRILLHSVPGSEDACKQFEYAAQHNVMTSDHAPVYGRFRLNLRTLPVIGSLPRARLVLSSLEVTLNVDEKDSDYSEKIWVHVSVPHTRVVLPKPRDVSSKHVDCSKPENGTATYRFTADDMPPNVIMGYDESDEEILAEQKKASERFALLLDKDKKDKNSVPERTVSIENPVGFEEYGKFLGVLTVVDSRLGDKLGACSFLLPKSKSSKFEGTIALFSETIGKVKGTWSVEPILS